VAGKLGATGVPGALPLSGGPNPDEVDSSAQGARDLQQHRAAHERTPKLHASISLTRAATILLVGVLSWLALVTILLYADRNISRRRIDIKPDQKPPDHVDDPGAGKEFLQHHKVFSDLYGELWRAAGAPDSGDVERREILMRWHQRLERIGQPNLLAAWSDASEGTCRERAVAWLDRLVSWGLVRDHPSTIEINPDSLRRFHVHPSSKSGVALVKEPCWTFNGRILEKGHAVVAREQ
jgi:hypothetical protein